MPFPEEGTLTTEYKEVSVSGSFGETEWNNAVSSSGVEVSNGVVSLVEIVTVIENWDSYSVGVSSPGDWTNVNGNVAVSDTKSYSGSNSYLIDSDISPGNRYIEQGFTAEQYIDAFRSVFYEVEANHSRSAVEYYNSDGDTILFVGTNSTQILAEGDTTTQIDGGTADRWAETRVTFNWGDNPTTAFVEYGAADFSSPESSDTVEIKSVSTEDIAGVAITHGGDSSTWGGAGNEIYYDDITVGQ